MTGEQRDRLAEDLDSVLVSVSQSEDELRILAADRANFIETATAVRRAVLLRYKELRALIKAQELKLLQELKEIRNKRVSDVDSRCQQIEAHLNNAELFRKRCEAVRLKGSSNKTSVVQQLRATAAELVRVRELHNTHPQSAVDLSFTPKFSASSKVKNLVGKLNFRELSSAVTALLHHPKVLKVFPAEGAVCGLAVHAGELFVSRLKSAHIQVYDSTSFQPTRTVQVSGLRNPEDLTACERERCLYVSEPSYGAVHRVNQPGGRATRWSISETWSRLSVSSISSNVLLVQAIPEYPSRIQEYTPAGKFVKRIVLDPSLDSPLHTIQLSSTHYAVCHQGASQHRICIVDASGRIVQSYDGGGANGEGQLNTPTCIAMDKYDHVFVADCYNSRVRLLSPTLKHMGDVEMWKHELDAPAVVLFEEGSGRLYVGEGSGGRVFVLVAERTKRS